jgi:ABC-2 type transport system permease protein
MLLPALSLGQRELVRFLRQRNRVVGALLTPIVFWLLIGGGMGRSFSATSAGAAGETRGYMNYFFPGTVLMILLFTAIFSTISVIEDRREGFLQSVLVAPVSRMSVVLGKVLGGTALAVGQAFVFLLLAPLVGVRVTMTGAALALLVMVLVAFALTCLGLAIAWRMSSTQGFHAIMNLFLMPMWFMSGALFPASGAWKGLRYVMLANPLTYGLAALRRAIDPHDAGVLGLPGFGVSLLVTAAFAAVMLILAGRIAESTVPADLQ